MYFPAFVVKPFISVNPVILSKKPFKRTLIAIFPHFFPLQNPHSEAGIDVLPNFLEKKSENSNFDVYILGPANAFIIEGQNMSSNGHADWIVAEGASPPPGKNNCV